VTAIDKAAVRKYLRAVNDILNTDWDPIGGCPDDEYESYAGQITAMMRDNASDDALVQYLKWAELEHMGLPPPFDATRAHRVVATLRNLGRLGQKSQ
jgi:hypothetical protein